MNNFDYHVTTDIRFGHNQIQCLPEELAKFGKKVLLVYGVGSIKKNGIYDTLKSLLKDFEVFELFFKQIVFRESVKIRHIRGFEGC